MAQILLVGAGNIGFAMLSRWSTSSSHCFSVLENSSSSRLRIGEIGVAAWSDVTEIMGQTFDLIIIATKPQVVLDVVNASQHLLSSSGFLISVAAGITTKSIEDRLAMPLPIIRCMPNTPALVGEGMTVCYANELVAPGQQEMTTELMSSIGLVHFVEVEEVLDAITAVSGSGPAYVFHFIESLATAAIGVGIEQTLAMRLAKQTVFGAAKLAIESEYSPARLREMVTSPNGTTAAALDVLMGEHSGLCELMSRAVSSAQNRSRELRGTPSV